MHQGKGTWLRIVLLYVLWMGVFWVVLLIGSAFLPERIAHTKLGLGIAFNLLFLFGLLIYFNREPGEDLEELYRSGRIFLTVILLLAGMAWLVREVYLLYQRLMAWLATNPTFSVLYCVGAILGLFLLVALIDSRSSSGMVHQSRHTYDPNDYPPD